MKIQKVKVKGYKAFHKDYSFDIKGKNVFIYGENGSGKSSFYYALKDFFQSSIEKIDFDELENIFLTKKQKGKSYVKVTFKPDKDGNWRLKKEGASRASKVFEGSNKNEATRKSASTLKNRDSASSLKIHKENGRIQEERTYPRKADPSKSKG